eukprot:2663143-Pyramimonas_sp.AAC.1
MDALPLTQGHNLQIIILQSLLRLAAALHPGALCWWVQHYLAGGCGTTGSRWRINGKIVSTYVLRCCTSSYLRSSAEKLAIRPPQTVDSPPETAHGSCRRGGWDIWFFRE